MPDLIELKDIVKVFPPQVVALDSVSVSFRPGEIHAVVGENGAGKSTLMKVLSGLYAPDGGAIIYEGRPAQFHSPADAMAAGIGMVHQEILLISEYTVWENIILGVEPTGRLGRLDVAQARRRVRAEIDEFQFNLDPDARAGDISVAARQKVEILKLLYRNVSVLILDEPTAVLAPQEIPQLFGELRRLRAGGQTILFVSHHLDEVLALSDRVTVLRKGCTVATVPAAGTRQSDLAEMMIGRELLLTKRRSASAPGAIIFDARDLTTCDSDGRERLKHVNLTVRAGEIVGMAGVEGNGQFELVNTIVGLTPPDDGALWINGHDLTRASILERRRHLAFVPQDRGRMGASLPASISENAIMTHHRLTAGFARWGGWLLDFGRARQFTESLRQRFSVTMDDPDDAFHSLSGGNQQKVILGRELLLNRPFMLLDQPTRGLDVGSIEYVHQQIDQMRAANRAVLLISADLDELFHLADRMVVLWRGAIVADVPTGQTNIDEVGLWMLEGRQGAAPGRQFTHPSSD